jgi:hypothetical protein
MKSIITLALAALAFAAAPATAITTTYTSQASFQAALTGNFTLINFDAAPLNGFASGYRVDDTGPAAAFLGLGIDFINFNAQVVGGQAFQLPTAGRDRIVLNGSGFGGTIATNFTTPVNGVGALSNIGDGGRVRIFSGANLGGTFLGEFGFSGTSFGGITSDQTIGSAEFTCDFNFDLSCGVYDVQFGTTAVPEPNSWVMLIAGFGLIGSAMRRRFTVAAA